MFSVPYLVTTAKGNVENDLCKDTVAMWQIIYKSLPILNLLAYSLWHPTTIFQFFNTNKLKIKQEKATSLSKLTAEYLKEIQA